MNYIEFCWNERLSTIVLWDDGSVRCEWRWGGGLWWKQPVDWDQHFDLWDIYGDGQCEVLLQGYQASSDYGTRCGFSPNTKLNWSNLFLDLKHEWLWMILETKLKKGATKTREVASTSTIEKSFIRSTPWELCLTGADGAGMMMNAKSHFQLVLSLPIKNQSTNLMKCSQQNPWKLKQMKSWLSALGAISFSGVKDPATHSSLSM